MVKDPSICVVGLGYVGLPLAAAFGKTQWKTYGFDINAQRIKTLQEGSDWTKELSTKQLKETNVIYSSDPKILGEANTIIVAVPTPINNTNDPDLTPIIRASETVGENMQKGTVIVYESTVYPGVTEDICVPILEKMSGLKCGQDFWVGYSPERINPGDKEHTIEKIVKIVAGQDAPTLDWVAKVYGGIITAGVHRAPNIKVAELAKALENTQRDINIALMNEIARFCSLLGINSKDVLDAASTKWNFLKFTPGLVGGHCIGVDPYYLVHKAKELGMHTEVIAAGRKINDSMPAFITEQILYSLKKANKSLKARILVLGLTFKENIPDTRNAKVHDIIQKLLAAGCDVRTNDSEITEEAIKKLGFASGTLSDGPFDVILLAVSHRSYTELTPEKICNALAPGGTFYDLKSLFSATEFTSKGYNYISL